VSCLSSRSGPVNDQPFSLAIRTSSAAAAAPAVGTGFFLGFTASSVVVITAPSPPARLAQRVGPKTPLRRHSQLAATDRRRQPRYEGRFVSFAEVAVYLGRPTCAGGYSTP